jgi:hypothetical protein
VRNDDLIALLEARLQHRGLRPDQCLAIWFSTSAAVSTCCTRGASLPEPGFGVPLQRTWIRDVATEAATGRVMHEHFSDGGCCGAASHRRELCT